MCGIAGLLSWNGETADADLLTTMIESIGHRGPDDRGIWTGRGVGLAHVRLSILDPSRRGHQPFVTPDGSGVIAYNGEIYNFRELRACLVAEGARFESDTDTEVALQALHRWGVEAATKRFDGMFAFAYRDLRNQSLWLGRDPIGIKPLYLAETPDGIAFASEIKALLAHPGVRGRTDLHALTTHTLCHRLTGTWTPFEGVESVLPGTLVRMDATGRSEPGTYFDVLDEVDPSRIAAGTEESFAAAGERLDGILRESVASHMISDAPLATMCSGGLDSSLITAMAKRSKPDLIAYVADVKETPHSEVERAERVCRGLEVELRHVPVRRNDFLRLLPDAVYHNDQPSYFPQNIASMAIARAVQRDGFKVLLAGSAADELFGGYSWQVEVYRMWRLRRLHQKLIPDAAPFRFLGKWLARLDPIDLGPLKERPFEHLSQPPGARRAADGRAVAVDGLQREVRAAALFRKLEGAGPLEDRAFLARCFEDIYTHLRTSLESNDKMAMSASVEMRFPFLGREIIDFGLHLPRPYKYGRRTTKRLLKHVGERYLPSDIVHAPKIGFGSAPAAWRSALDLLQGGYVATIFKWGRREEADILERIRRDNSVAFHLLALEVWGQIFELEQTRESLAERLLSLGGEPEPSGVDPVGWT